ncbi:unnamed protein product [Adineta steineri]|uniref:Ubiquitin-like protease family profile domain-containing protein n=1 Tax=Adineta steineri TaxID=433720 RepID=A0A813NXD2_9BILA|nr:unnamed protein product [Adineta steineri]CAF3736087.1 unnamed protein product [Adineta steineri]
MAARTNLPDQSSENIVVRSVLETQLNNFIHDYRQHISTPFYVLATVHDNVDGQLQERLREAKRNITGKRITVIPYRLANSHWTGLVIKFNTNQNIECAEFNDPVMDSTFNLENLENIFTEIFPDTSLISRPVQYPSDRTSSGLALIRHLIRAIASSESRQIKLPDEGYFPFPGNENKLRKLRKEFDDGLIKLKSGFLRKPDGHGRVTSEFADFLYMIGGSEVSIP